MSFENEPKWEDIQNTLKMLIKRKIVDEDDIDESLLFDQLAHLQFFFDSNHLHFEQNNLTVSEKWVELFKNKNSDFCGEYLKICYIFFAIPAQNVNSERIFSFMNLQWTDERNRLLASTMKALIMVQYNLCKKFTCDEFYDLVVKEERLLKQSKTVEKYNFNKTS